ncbi:MAG: heme exporter protein CcmD [Acidimicrobiales bacterium]|nr:heme exporter protein CcmD [Hyphomonadaceae bacterium]RZV38168.1 MAG: heme exporter protein CcmD [Acidimicrobiales bacterium]
MSSLIPDFGKYAATIWICYGASVTVLLVFTYRVFRNNRLHK